MAAVLQYLAEELVELAGDICNQSRRARINPRHILLAVKKDAELSLLLKDVTISYGGVLSDINPKLLPKSSK